MQSTLEIRMLGTFEACVDGEVLVPLHSRKEHWLLALLTLRYGRHLERDWLAGTLWPESEQSQALGYMRQCLAALRKQLGAHAERIQSPTRNTLSFDVRGIAIDFIAFDADLKNGELSGMERAVGLYRGMLLEGCTEEWVSLEREAREQAYLNALDRLATNALANDGASKAVGYLKRVIAVDRLQEKAHRDLMRAYVASGDYGASVQVYRDLRTYLHSELNAEPDAETNTLYQLLRAEAQRRRQAVVLAKPPPVVEMPDAETPTAIKKWLSRIPLPLNRLIGRDAEREEVRNRVASARLVTLTGTGGVGKTRLSLQAAEDMFEDFSGGAWFVELAALSDPNLLVQTVAAALEITEKPNQSLLSTLLQFLGARRALLILDNCEHLVEACAKFADAVLRSCEGLHILTTSRERLGLTGEVMWQVPSLKVPPAQWIAAREKEMTSLLEYSAVQLFVERAKQVDPTFRVNGTNVLAAAQVCTRLDGIPLAIELAAARVSLLSVPQILERLDNRFRLLTGGNRTSLPRQQTLRALIDWSYDLLNAQERELLQRLSVFSGGWTFEAAEQIGSSERIEDWETLDLMSELIAKSLVMAEIGEGERRFRLLETVRQYAEEKLEESGESEAVRTVHRDYFLKFAEGASPKLRGAEQTDWFQRLDMEHDNLRSGIEWSLAESDGQASLRFCGALDWYWWTRGRYAEGRMWCDRTLEVSAGSELLNECIKERATTLNAAGSYSAAQGECAASWRYHEECLKMCREAHYLSGVAQALRDLGSMAEAMGDLDQARDYYREAHVAYQDIGSTFGSTHALGNLGRLDKVQGDYEAAKISLEACSKTFRALGNLHLAVGSLSCLGGIALIQGDYAVAKARFEESLAVFRGVRDHSGVASSLGYFGNLALYQGDFAVARAYFEERVAIRRTLADREYLAESLNDLGRLALAINDYASAKAYFDESLPLSKQVGASLARGGALSGLGSVALEWGDCPSVRAFFEEALTIYWKSGIRLSIAESLEMFGRLAVKESRMEHAVTLLGAAHGLREALGAPLPPYKQQGYEQTLSEARQALDNAVFLEAWAQGCALPLDSAIEYALSRCPTS